MPHRSTCLLCDRSLEPLDNGTQRHPAVEDCEVQITDSFGVAVQEQVEVEAEGSGEKASPFGLDIQLFPFVDEILADEFEQLGLRRLGGESSGRGWSSFSLFQRCPYAWKQRYITQAKPLIAVESPSLAIGTLIHVFLALYYTGMMDGSPYRTLTPEMMYERVRMRANPEFVSEAWRVFVAYTQFYKFEHMIPLAVEYNIRDPRTGESCRYDLITYVPEEQPGLMPGTYIVEHKSSGRFDTDFVEGWVNDGEVIGQVMIYEQLGLHHRFGPLRGVMMNLLGKQKEPKFHRTIVSPSSWQLEQQRRDLARWESLIHLARASDTFARSRGNCIGRYGRCNWFEHCATGEE